MAERAASKQEKIPAYGFCGAVLTLGGLLKDMGRLEEADVLYRDALPLTREHVDVGYTVDVLMNWGDIKQLLNEYDQAEKHYREAFALTASPTLKDANQVRSFRSRSTVSLGDSLVGQGKKSEAEETFREVTTLGDDYLTDVAHCRLIDLLSKGAEPRMKRWTSCARLKHNRDTLERHARKTRGFSSTLACSLNPSLGWLPNCATRPVG